MKLGFNLGLGGGKAKPQQVNPNGSTMRNPDGTSTQKPE